MTTQIDNWEAVLHEFQREYNKLDNKFNNLPPLERKAIKRKYIKIIEEAIALAKEEEMKRIVEEIKNISADGFDYDDSPFLIKEHLINKLNKID